MVSSWSFMALGHDSNAALSCTCRMLMSMVMVSSWPSMALGHDSNATLQSFDVLFLSLSCNSFCMSWKEVLLPFLVQEIETSHKSDRLTWQTDRLIQWCFLFEGKGIALLVLGEIWLWRALGMCCTLWICGGWACCGCWLSCALMPNCSMQGSPPPPPPAGTGLHSSLRVMVVQLILA